MASRRTNVSDAAAHLAGTHDEDAHKTSVVHAGTVVVPHKRRPPDWGGP